MTLWPTDCYTLNMIPTFEFGRTGHKSSRIIFGAAAFFNIEQAAADRAMERVLDAGVNHIDTAAGYGASELRLAPFLKNHRSDVFLATKTGERSYQGAREGIRRSLDRLGVDQIDLIQFHHLVSENEWEQVFSEDGALRAATEARDEGLVRFIGVTGHGTRPVKMHQRSIERFDFDSVLLPYNYSMMQDSEYSAGFDKLHERCREKRVAVQTIKAVARRRWPGGTKPTAATWYEPLPDADSIKRAVHWALGREGIFVNSAADLNVLEHILAAAQSFEHPPEEDEMSVQQSTLGVQPLFVSGFKASA